MTRYLAKEKYPQYINTIDKICISEKAVLEAFIMEIQSFLNVLYYRHIRDINKGMRRKVDNAIFKIGLVSIQKAEESTGKTILANLPDELYAAFVEEKGSEAEKKEAVKRRLTKGFIMRWGKNMVNVATKQAHLIAL